MRNIKKRIVILSLFALLIMILVACGNVTDDLQAQKWNVVATNGEAYTAEFAEDTATFKLGEFMTIGMGYSIKNKEITLIDKDQESHVFIIEKNNGEYQFKAKTDEVKKRFGDLTLSPVK